jgi:hypothetical protein
MAFGQAPVAPNPVPNAGVMIEPLQGQGGPTSKFTNSTDNDLGILYGKNKFILKPGKTHSIPIPQQEIIDLKIFEKRPDDRLVTRYASQTTPNAEKRFIPLRWAKPNKQEEAQQDAP